VCVFVCVCVGGGPTLIGLHQGGGCPVAFSGKPDDVGGPADQYTGDESPHPSLAVLGGKTSASSASFSWQQ
jgi:hypothetical protein